MAEGCLTTGMTTGETSYLWTFGLRQPAAFTPAAVDGIYGLGFYIIARNLYIEYTFI